jgi:hypothetical protein
MPRQLAITVESVRDEIGGSGMEMFLSALGDASRQNDIIARHIKTAQSYLEKQLGIYLFRQVVKCRPLEAGLVEGADYDVADDSYDFIRRDWQTTAQIKVRKRPVVSVERVALRYGQGEPHEVLEAVSYPTSWISFDSVMGLVYVIPVMGSVHYGSGAMLLLSVTGGAVRRDILPSFVTVDYTAGYLPKTFNAQTDDPYDASFNHDVIETLLQAVREYSAMLVLQNAERSIGAGGGSIAMYGLSESFTGDRFTRAKEGYDLSVKTFIAEFNMTERAPAMFTLGGGGR